MKICLIANPKGIYIQRWAEFYVQNNHEVHIIYMRRIFDDSKKVSISGVKIHTITLLSNIMLNAQSFLTVFQLKKILKEIKPDILHVHYISYHAWLAAKIKSHPLIVSAWGGDIYIEAKNLKKNLKWVEYSLKKADLITTTSKTLKKYIIENFNVNKNKIQNFYWGQDLTVFKKGYDQEVEKLKKSLKIDKDSFVILSIRNMTKNHGIHYIVEIIPYLIKKRKNVKFIFLRGYGDLEFEKNLKKRIKELKVEKYVIFISKFLSAKELAVYDNMADIVISLPVSDQFSGAVEEAMACGAIPVLRNLEVYEEHIKDKVNGFFVDREKPTEIAETIIYCMDNHPELKNNFARINRKILEEKCDWNKNSNIMIKIYNELINDKKK